MAELLENINLVDLGIMLLVVLFFHILIEILPDIIKRIKEKRNDKH